MLELKNLSKSFSSNLRPALNKINLTITAGDYCIIIGNNGSGKSTMLKLISGEHIPSIGHIYLNQKNITAQAIHLRAERISTVSQDINKGTISDLTVAENIVLSNMRSLHAKYKFYGPLPNHIYDELQQLGFAPNILSKKMSELSGGQRQVIACLMATTPVPDLLLLDEHTSALDTKTRSKIIQSTNQIICEKKITTLMVTHNIHDAIKYGNRLIIMSYGEIIHDFSHEDKLKLTEQQILTILNDAEPSS